MSQGSRFQPGSQRFRETLRHEDQIQDQINVCRKAFNLGDLTEIMNDVESLYLIITPAMEDERFIADLIVLKEDWKKQQAEQKKIFLARLKLAGRGCPDLVPKPSQKPNIQYFKKMFMIACALFERKNLMLKVSVDDDI